MQKTVHAAMDAGLYMSHVTCMSQQQQQCVSHSRMSLVTDSQADGRQEFSRLGASSELMRIARTRRLTQALQTANAMNQIYICTQHGARVLQERRGVDACAFPSAYARIQLGSLIDMMPGIQATVPPTGTCCSKLLTTCI